ncbi:hypothetical protein KC362_g16181 [Hortaea werneckii]|nr:hypothetical protein KC362_g16181 [Hortaea werneckii]
MAAGRTNGRAKGPKSGSMDARTNSSGNTRASRSSGRRRSDRKQTWMGWATSKSLKLGVWYLIITLLFRCPNTLDEVDADSPAVCKPYFQAKTFVAPYAQPYYDQYAAPYVQIAQPYFDQAHQHAYKPALAAYKQHGAPRVAEAQKQALVQWEKTVKPQLEVVRQQAGKQYDATLAPHVKKVQDVVQPYYSSMSQSASDIWVLELQPVYRHTMPYAQKFYTQGQTFVVNTAWPQAQYAGSAAWSMWARQIWPRVRVLYGENVEPQLMRITERLGRYKDGRKLEAEIKSMEVEFSMSEASSSSTVASSSISSVVAEPSQKPSSSASTTTSSTVPEPSENPVEQFRSDLKSWEGLCSRAVDEGADDLKERIKEIADHQISSQVEGTGAALVVQLEETAEAAISSVKASILSTVGGLPEDAEQETQGEATEKIVEGIRSAGQNVKRAAQAVRQWEQQYSTMNSELVQKALQSTLETIDHIRDLRLTEIGRKYSDKGLPHKEWSRYNDLKKATQAWRDDVTEVTAKNEDLARAKEAAEEIGSKAMSVAEEVAKELGRLKDVAKWKVAAQDSTDDFSSKAMPPVAEKARDKVAEKVGEASEAVFGTSEPAKENVETATSSASKAATQAAESAESAKSQAAASVKVAANDARDAARQSPLKESAESASQAAFSLGSEASDSVKGSSSKLGDVANKALTDASAAFVESEIPAASSTGSSLSSKASNQASESLGPKAASILAAGKSQKDAASRSATEASSKASESAASVADEATADWESAKSAASEEASSLSDDASVAAEDVVSKASQTSSSLSDTASSSVASASSEATDSVSTGLDPVAESLSAAAHESNMADEVSSSLSSLYSTIPEAASETATQASSKVFAGAMAQVLVEAREPILDVSVDDEDDETVGEKINSASEAAADQAQRAKDAVQQAIENRSSRKGAVESVSSVASEQYESAVSAAGKALHGTQKGAIEDGEEGAKSVYKEAVHA